MLTDCFDTSYLNRNAFPRTVDPGSIAPLTSADIPVSFVKVPFVSPGVLERHKGLA